MWPLMTISKLLKSWATPPARRPDRFHFLRLAQLLFEKLALADVLRDHQADGAARVFQLVRDDIDFEALAILALVTPVAVMAAVLFPFFDMLGKRRFVAVRANVAEGHAAKIIFRKAVLLGRGFINLQEAQRFDVEDPHGQRGMGKQQAEHGLALAERFFRANTLDRECNVPTHGIQKFQVPLVVSVFIPVMLNHHHADSGAGSLQRNAEPGRRGEPTSSTSPAAARRSNSDCGINTSCQFEKRTPCRCWQLFAEQVRSQIDRRRRGNGTIRVRHRASQ